VGDGCRVAFCPAWGIGLGASSEGWEAQLHKLDEYRWLTAQQYYGPDWFSFSEESDSMFS
jgi:hypothetical protein